MTANIKTAGVDIDTKFMARVNAKIADVGFKVAGVDISNRYEARGSAAAIANTGLKAAAVDLATLFRDINAPLVTHTLTAAVRDVTADVGSLTIFTGLSDYWGGFGALAPTTYAGAVVSSIFDLNQGSFTFQVEMQGNRAKSFFSSIVINGVTFLTSTAGYAPSSSVTNWNWPTAAGLAAGSYSISINP
jgi:hypothetical protein